MRDPKDPSTPADHAILRLLDASANRAREALRTIEDYARFILNSIPLCNDLKTLRHDLAQSLQPYTDEAILHRDTPGDVGTQISNASESRRENLSAVVTAAGKRLGEALRSIEEFLKVRSSGDAAKIETFRYRFYEIERKISLTLRPPDRFVNVRLYVLITEAICKIPWLNAARQAIEGGADCLQLREKDLPARELLLRARQLVALCRAANICCIINDRLDIALASGADGVHLGQDDIPASDARKLAGRNFIIGVSTHNIAQARQAVLDSADYIGVGPIFKSATKPRDFVAGLQYAESVTREIKIPAVAIAGIDLKNVDTVLQTGIGAVAVTAAVLRSEDVAAATRAMKQKIADFVRQPATVGVS